MMVDTEASSVTSLAVGSPDILIAAGTHGVVVLPDRFPLVSARFDQEGDDLVVIATDGSRLVVEGFFGRTTPPALQQATGFELSGQTIAAMSAQGAVFWGRLHAFQGDAFVVGADGSRREVELDALLEPGASVETGDGASLAIVMPDGALLSMGGNGVLSASAAMSTQDDTAEAEQRYILHPERGEFTVLTAETAGGPLSLHISTPFGDITLYGGQLGLHLNGGLSTTLMQTQGRFAGAALVETPWGSVTLDSAFASTTLAEGAAPAPVFTAAEIDAIDAYADSLLQLPLLRPDANDFGLQTISESGSTENELPDVEVSVTSDILAPTPEYPQPMETLPPTPEDELQAAAPSPPEAPPPKTPSDRPPEPAGESVETVVAQPVLTAEDVGGIEDQPLLFDITAHVAEPAEISELIISGIPDGAALNLGADDGAGCWTLAGADLDHLDVLTLTPVPDSATDFEIEVTVVSTEGAVTIEFFMVTLDAEADTPTLSVSDVEVAGLGEPGPQDLTGTSGADTLVGGGGEDVIAGRGGDDVLYGDEPTAIEPRVVALDIEAALTDVDASELLRIEVAGVPEGGALSAGNDTGNGWWELAPEDLDGLQLTLPADVDTDLTLSVSAIATDTDPDTGATDMQTVTSSLDIVFASGPEGADQISGGGGDDWIDGGGGDDVLSGGGGSDEVYGGNGADAISGGAGADELHGGAGNDEIAGGRQADVIYGDAGDDALSGDAGGDTIFGGDGDDQITGGRGADLLSGGGGNNRFIFDQRSDKDTITDFDIGDVLRFEGPKFSVDKLNMDTTDSGTVITFGNLRNVEVTLENIDLPGEGYTITQDPDALIITYDGDQ